MHQTYNKYIYMFRGKPLYLKSVDSGGRRYLAPNYTYSGMPFMVNNGYIMDNLAFILPVSQLPEEYHPIYSHDRDVETFSTDDRHDLSFIQEYIKVIPVVVTIETNEDC